MDYTCVAECSGKSYPFELQIFYCQSLTSCLCRLCPELLHTSVQCLAVQADSALWIVKASNTCSLIKHFQVAQWQIFMNEKRFLHMRGFLLCFVQLQIIHSSATRTPIMDVETIRSIPTSEIRSPMEIKRATDHANIIASFIVNPLFCCLLNQLVLFMVVI